MRLIFVVKLLIILSYNSIFTQSIGAANELRLGAERMETYLPYLSGKNIAIVANQTTVIGDRHLVDTLISRQVSVKKVFAPEHGFRGDVSAGVYVESNKDVETGLPVISLYGQTRKPSAEDLKGIDIVIFDIQDVGARFYTYISTMHYVMEACAENDVSFMVLDRPNPHGRYIDGPILEEEFKSFVGMHPVPVVHGMTVGEYAKMINGEAWLKNGIQCDLKVIKMENYTKKTEYVLPIPPSPNLQSMDAIYLYPSLCFFEGTDVSVGRGTDHPFEVIGKPGFQGGNYTFTPVPIKGVADNPPHKGKECNGFKVKNFAREYVVPSKQIYLLWLIGFYENAENQENFFNNFFDLLAGTDKLRKQIIAGKSHQEIRDSWQPGLEAYDKFRRNYLLYPSR